MDFAIELQKLLAEETPLLDPLAELAKSQLMTLESITKNTSDISLQVEEIYDIVKDSDENAKEIKNAAKREEALLASLVAVNDLIDTLLQHFAASDTSHITVIAAKREEILRACGIEKTGYPGQMLDPKIHTVAAAEKSEAPRESITRVLESGYIYKGSIVRKATVIVSTGAIAL